MLGSNIREFLTAALDTSEPSLQLQNRAYEYGMNKNDTALLAQLATLPNLYPEIDAKLRNHKSAVVKAAWASRPNRSADELAGMIEGEKRVTVLNALARLTELPDYVHTSLIANSPSRGPLLEIVKNPALAVDHRLAAATKLLQVRPDDSLHARWGDAADVLQHVIDIEYDLGAITTEPAHWAAAVLYRALTAPQQLAVAELLAALQDGNNTNAADLELITRVLDAFADRGDIDPIAGKILVECAELTIKTIKNTQYRYRASSVEDTVKRLRSEISGTAAKFEQQIREADSTEVIDKIITKVNSRQSGSRQISHDRLANMALLVLMNQHSTVKQIERIEDWFGYHFAAQALRLTSNPGKIAWVLLKDYYVDLELLHQLPNAIEVMHAIIERCKGDKTQLPDELLESPLLTVEMLYDLPFAQILDDSVPRHLRDQAFARIISSLSEQELWETFVSLGDEFEGSLNDLLNVAVSV